MARGRDRRRRERAKSPEADYLRVIGVWLLALKFALVPVIFDPTALTVFALPKTIVSDSLAAALAVVLVILALRDGLRSLIRNPVVLAVAVFFVAYAIAAVFALDRYLAIFGSHDRLLGLIAAADVAITAVALIVVPRPEHLRLLVTAAFVGGVISAAYGALQLARLDPLQWSQTGPRIFSTLGNPTVLGHYLAVLAAGALAFASFPAAKTRDRVVLVALAATFLVIALGSGTRAVALALPIYMVLAVLVVRRALPARGVGLLRRVSRTVVVGAVGGAALVALLTALQLYGARITALVSDPTTIGDDRSVAGRVAIYEVALDAFRDHPWTGVGPDNFEVAFPTYRPERFFAVNGVVIPDTSAHSWLASMVSDAGLIGIVAFVALLVVLVFATRRRPSALALVGWSLITSYLAVGIVTVNHIATLWLFWAGVAAIASEGASSATSTRRIPPALVAFPVVVAVLWLGASVPALAASRSAQTANGLTDAGRYDRAVASGLEAVNADAPRAVYWQSLGVAYTRQGKYANARDAFLNAWKRAPHNVLYLTFAARNEVALAQRTGDNSALAPALLHAVNAVATDPNNPEAQFALALAFAANGRYEEAVRASERGRQLDTRPRDINAYETAASAYVQLKRFTDAERWAKDGLAVGFRVRDTIPLRLTLAQALVALGRNKEALEQISVVTAEDPQNAEAARIVAQINAKP